MILLIQAMIFQAVVLMVLSSGTSAFLAPAPKSINSIKVYATSQSDQDGKEATSEGLVPSGFSLQSQLANAFSNLDESDQYDAVLTGLCAKILDQPSLGGDDVIVALEDPISLLEEMNARRVSAGSRSLMALVDVSAMMLVSNTAKFQRSLCVLFIGKHYFHSHEFARLSRVAHFHERYYEHFRQQLLQKIPRRWPK